MDSCEVDGARGCGRVNWSMGLAMWWTCGGGQPRQDATVERGECVHGWGQGSVCVLCARCVRGVDGVRVRAPRGEEASGGRMKKLCVHNVQEDRDAN